MRMLVTGGAGFIGSRLATALLAAGHEVAVLDSLHPQVHRRPGRPADLPAGAELIPIDVADAQGLDRSLMLWGRPDVVIHLAAETGTGQSLTEASRHGRVNVLGTCALVDALHRRKAVPERIVLASSRAVYGEGRWRDEDETTFYPAPRSSAQLAAGQWDPRPPGRGVARPTAQEASCVWPRPTNVYAATKLAQEHVLGAWCSSFGTSLRVLRLQNVYGPGQAVGNTYTGVLTFFARQLLSGDSIEVYEDGLIVRDFVYVDDVVSAMVAAAERDQRGGLLVDVGSGAPSTLLEVAVMMAELAGGPPPTIVGKFRLGDVRAAWADVRAARALLGWEPRTVLRDGLEQMLERVRAELDEAHYADVT